MSLMPLLPAAWGGMAAVQNGMAAQNYLQARSVWGMEGPEWKAV